MQVKILWTIFRSSNPVKVLLSRPAAFTARMSLPPRRSVAAYERTVIIPTTTKVESEVLKSIYTPELNTLADIFKRHGFELRVAGGAVRDLIMGIKPHDLDFATTATPDQMKDMFTEENVRMINTKGERHGTITPRINDKENFEVTTLRIDVTTDGRHAEVQFTTDWQLDANRRDLTINSLFMDLDGVVYDYFHGVEDIKQRRVLFVGDAATRIQEDFLRILRYFRFYGRISREANHHDPATLQAIKNNLEGLTRISGERIWSELGKILEGNFAGELMKTMVECGIMPFIGLPEHPDMEYFELVWNRLKVAPYHPVSLLSALLNTENDALELQARLKMSAFERDLLIFLLKHRDLEPGSEEPLRPYQRLVIMEKFKPPDLHKWSEQLLLVQGRTDLAQQMTQWAIPRFPVNGNLVRDAGCPRGKVLGQVLLRLRVLWLESGFSLTPEQLLAVVPEVAAELPPSPPAEKKSPPLKRKTPPS